MKTTALVASAVLLCPALSLAATLQVGADKTYPAPCAAIAVAKDGDLIEIDAATYRSDYCAVKANNLTLRGVGGRPVLDAEGSGALGKGIWVVQGTNTTIENIEFTNAKVGSANGAGIRQESKDLTVRNCAFRNNENGILENNIADSTIIIEGSEFDRNGDGVGQAHNMYIGRVKRFELRNSYSHDAKVGHLVKSRARENVIEYNRLTGEQGTASYEIDLSNGGVSWIVGNVIEQAESSANNNVISYGMEGLTADVPHALYVSHNTFVNKISKGRWINMAEAMSGEVKLVNNIFSGVATFSPQAETAQLGSCTDAPSFVNEAAYDFHLAPGSACLEGGVDPGMGAGRSLTPAMQYVHPASAETRTTVGVIDRGAFELGGGGLPGASSSSSGGGASSGGTSDGGSSGTGSGSTTSGGASSGGASADGAAADGGDDSGCACSTTPGSAPLSALGGIAALSLVLRRRRRA